jgi:drug/metabolite transporter (DMT)-like permease
MKFQNTQAAAVAEAFLVTFLWSTSWVIIKIGLVEIPPLVFAGLRYGLAFLVLLVFALISGLPRREWRRLTARDWAMLVVLGLIFYALTQGSMVIALKYLPSASVSLLLNFTTPLVAWLGMIFLKEWLTKGQWLGIVVFMAGALVYFLPLDVRNASTLGWAAASVCIAGNAVAGLLGRSVNRRKHLSPLSVTTLTMGIGGLTLIISGAVWEGIPLMRWQSWAMIAWLAVVNSALAFTLWNHTQRYLAAAESSLINNTMLIQITFLAWVFLREPVGVKQALGLGLAAIGAAVVQLRGQRAN